jgi:hypothetical protein
MSAVQHLDPAAELDVVGDLGTLEFPRIAEIEPVLRQLDLPAITDSLPEHPVIVADAVAVPGQPDGRHALHEARGKAAEAAIAKRRIWFEFG